MKIPACLTTILISSTAFAAALPFPTDSICATSADHRQTVLLNALESKRDIPHGGGWHIKDVKASIASDVTAKVAKSAVRFTGTADISGGKGDVTLVDWPGGVVAIGLWVYLPENANVETLGFQIRDNEGEALMKRIPADWTGWRWIEEDLIEASFDQAYSQKDKNKLMDHPIKNIHLFWFSKNPGTCDLVVDGLVGIKDVQDTDTLIQTKLIGSDVVDAGGEVSSLLVIHNYSSEKTDCQVVSLVQRNPNLKSLNAPDPVWGVDHAIGTKSRLEVNGQVVAQNTLTDGSDISGYSSNIKDTYTEALHTVDLGKLHTITHLQYVAGDANWIHKMDLFASTDGKQFSPVKDLQSVDMHKRWKKQDIEIASPIKACALRLRYHKDGEVLKWLRTPLTLSVFNGPQDDDFSIPEVGEEINRLDTTVTIPPYSFVIVPCSQGVMLDSGAFTLALAVTAGSCRALLGQDLFVDLPEIKTMPDDSQFGLNASSFSYPDINRRLGVKWIRFENMKWQMFSSGPETYAFDGGIGPWRVNHDEYVQMYRDRGMNVLPYTFQTPRWTSTAPAGHKNSRAFAPKNNEDYGEAMYQLAARYGSKKQDSKVLKTKDKISGKGQISTFELWNEPNLEGENWAPWAGTMGEYWELFRIGAEGVKRADSSALVSHAGFAGCTVDLVNQMRTYTYADGRHPLDFTDLINVHYYSGRQNPETATLDRNANRSGKASADAPAFPEVIRGLVDWRDDYAADKEIWMTETGNDVGGVMGLGEREQACKIPRVTMLQLAAGVDKVFIYRERGSNPTMHAGAGLCRNDDSLRPSWFTYGTLIRQFLGVNARKALRLNHPDQDVWIHIWNRSDKPLLTVWTVGENKKFDIELGSCRVVDAFGYERQESTTADIILSEFPQYISDFTISPVLRELVIQARKEEKTRQTVRSREKQRKAYLYDFGSTEYVGILMLGMPRPYIPVMSFDVYDDVKGYGFSEKAMRDDTARWCKDVLEKDSTRINAKQKFIFKANPGSYKLSVRAKPVSSKATLNVVSGGEHMDILLERAEPQSSEPIIRTIQVDDSNVVIGADAYMGIKWIQLVEVD